MFTRRLALGIAGLGLLALAAWLVPRPRLNPQPDLPEIPPFTANDRIALILPEPDEFPAVEALGLAQRTRAAGAEVRVFPALESMAGFAPTRIYQPLAAPGPPTGYHPDQWPAMPNGITASRQYVLLVLSPAEMRVKNAAVLAAARAIQASGSDTPEGTYELQMLANARRAEIYVPLLARLICIPQ